MDNKLLVRAKTIEKRITVEGCYGAVVECGDNGGTECNYRETATEIHYVVELDGTSHMIDEDTVQRCTGIHDDDEDLIFVGDTIRTWGGTEHCGYHEHDKTFVIKDDSENAMTNSFVIGESEHVKIIRQVKK